MHLSEELGEATTELGWMQMIWRAKRKNILLGKDKLRHAFEISGVKTREEMRKITDRRNRGIRKKQIQHELGTLKVQLKKDPWNALQALIGERFKEEIADILSWLSAIIVKLDPKLEMLARTVPKKFIKTTVGVI